MVRLDGLDIGRPVALKVSPMEDKVALTNHRHELLVVDLERRTLTRVDRSPYRHIAASTGHRMAVGWPMAVRSHPRPRRCGSTSCPEEGGTGGAEAENSARLIRSDQEASEPTT